MIMVEENCNCGKKLTWVNEYNRYYCHNCRKYSPQCPECNKDLSWVVEYGRYYCNNCLKYPEPVKSKQTKKIDQIRKYEVAKIEKEFAKLSEQHKKGKLDTAKYKDALNKMKFKDEYDRFWTIGAQTGKWYCYDGNNWVESVPPQTLEGQMQESRRKKVRKA